MRDSAVKAQRADSDGPRVTDDNAVVFRGDGEPKSIPRMIAQLQKQQETEAPVLDVFMLGGIVEKLEKRFAEVLGKEAAIFMPTGTLANHLVLRRLCGVKRRAIVQEQSHLYHDTGDSTEQLSGLSLVPLGWKRPYFDCDEVEALLKAGKVDRVARPIGALMIETPVRRAHGLAVPYETMVEIAGFCKDHGIPTHLDGARLHLLSAVTGIPVAQYAAPFDTVYVSLYKYFGAPFGAILAGPRDVLDGMYHTRRMFGGGLASAGFAAALAYAGMDGFDERFRAAMEKAYGLIALVNGNPRITIERPEGATNVFPVRFAEGVDQARFVARLRDKAIFLFPDELFPDRYFLTINTSLLRQPNDAIAAAFDAALAP